MPTCHQPPGGLLSSAKIKSLGLWLELLLCNVVTKSLRDEANLVRQMLIRRGGVQQDDSTKETYWLPPGVVQTLISADDRNRRMYPGSLTE